MQEQFLLKAPAVNTLCCYFQFVIDAFVPPQGIASRVSMNSDPGDCRRFVGAFQPTRIDTLAHVVV
eukprot:6479954-Amphidinium_carterae.2